MRWTKKHWARLDREERSVLMETQKGLNRPNWWDGVYYCGGCREPLVTCICHEILERLTVKMGVPCPDI